MIIKVLFLTAPVASEAIRRVCDENGLGIPVASDLSWMGHKTRIVPTESGFTGMRDLQEYLRELGQSLSVFLERELPRINGKGWWKRAVISVLTTNQLDNVKRRRITVLTGLDLAALLRVLDKNWNAISKRKTWPWEVRNFIRETLSIRNRWAHMGSHPVPVEDTYRDFDTMQRLAHALGDSMLEEKLGQA